MGTRVGAIHLNLPLLRLLTVPLLTNWPPRDSCWCLHQGLRGVKKKKKKNTRRQPQYRVSKWLQPLRVTCVELGHCLDCLVLLSFSDLYITSLVCSLSLSASQTHTLTSITKPVLSGQGQALKPFSHSVIGKKYIKNEMCEDRVRLYLQAR